MDRISSPSPLIACDEVEPGFLSGGVGFFCDALSDEESSHFLDSCFLCKKHLSGNRDIFMYRGDTPFCSEECRLQQIEMDECAEKWKRVRSTRQESGSPSKSEKIRVRFVAGTVVAS